MYQDFYLKFESESQANEILFGVIPFEMNATLVKANYRNIDVLGILYEKIPENASEDYIPAEIPGWHVNVRTTEEENSQVLEEFKVNPAPTQWRRVWAS